MCALATGDRSDILDTVHDRPIAPWWHTVLVLLPLMAGSVASAYQQGLPNAHLPGLSVKLSGYFTVMLEEWFVVLLIWLTLRRRGMTLKSLIGGRWDSAGNFFKDVGWSLAFLAVAMPLLGVLAHFVGASKNISQADITPKTVVQLALWVVLATTCGGFCEEVIFRGYLIHQFRAWTGSVVWGVAISSLFFGLAHGFYGRAMILVALHGGLLGALAVWRRSLRPGMLAHSLQDLLGGFVAFYS
jgi:membrane protease YdiL (CAAX protease family)